MNKSHLQYAGLLRRSLAFMYEALFLALLLLLGEALFQFVFQQWSGLPVTEISQLPWARNSNFAELLILALLYFAFCWRYGQTPAMRVWRMRIVGRDGARLGWRSILLRFAVAFFCFVPVFPLWILAAHDRSWLVWACVASGFLLLPFTWTLFDRDQLLLHDRLAGSRLILAPR